MIQTEEHVQTAPIRTFENRLVLLRQVGTGRVLSTARRNLLFELYSHARTQDARARSELNGG